MTKWLVDGKWLGPPRGGSKGDRKAQYERKREKRRLAREAAALAGVKRGPGRPPGRRSKQQLQAVQWMRRRLRGKQTVLGERAFAKAAHAKVGALTARLRAAVADAQSESRRASAAQERVAAAVTQSAEAAKYADAAWKQLKQFRRVATPFFAV